MFIRKVYNYKAGKRFGADESLMINLFLNELNKSYAKKQRIPPEKQFFKVKLYIEKALIGQKSVKNILIHMTILHHYY